MSTETPTRSAHLLEAWTVAGAVLVLRLPFLSPGFGLQPDGWRVALAARSMRATGRYVASRYGANPLHELLAVGLFDGLPLLLNLASALGAVALAEAVRRLVFHRGRGVRIAAALAAVGLPIVWIESVAGKDYLISTGLLAWALVFGLRGHPHRAGALLGLAAGFRLPMLIFAPALLVARPEPLGRMRLRDFTGLLTLGITAALALSPSATVHGMGILHSDDPAGYAPQRLLVSLPAAVGPLGLLGFTLAASAWVVAKSSLRLATGPSTASLAVLFLQGLLFVYNPGSSPSSYLVPTLPFAVVLVALQSSPACWPALALMTLSGALFGVSGPQAKQSGFQTAQVRFHLPGGRGLYPFYGEIFQNHDLRRQQQALIERVVREVEELPPGTLLLAGPWKPKLEWSAPGLTVAYRINPEDVNGRTVYALPGASKWSPGVHARPLPHPDDLLER
ncbi:MAG: hypothetical protein AAFU79_04920 [Myxococcota bacterium]